MSVSVCDGCGDAAASTAPPHGIKALVIAGKEDDVAVAVDAFQQDDRADAYLSPADRRHRRLSPAFCLMFYLPGNNDPAKFPQPACPTMGLESSHILAFKEDGASIELWSGGSDRVVLFCMLLSAEENAIDLL